ncbi:isochorismatase family cysteine hydrolase [Lacticaseibacillus mingshuiensis]|uniref:Isochorismatase family cysteine hydrolase n=1 Tax=Lacticaseibacillus mingshuiensis TaxID=2799574 RepID=A0ABW4CJR6_9LACO|nr:isochorismatase family cysteine hydrolase [Lacticaseibacillus mingshuiensis]
MAHQLSNGALLSIDVQQGSRLLANLLPQTTKTQYRGMVATHQALVSAFSQSGQLAVIVTDVPPFLRQNGWFGRSLLEGEEGTDLLRLQKPTPSAFAHTDLAARLRSRGITDLFVCGFVAEDGVLNTVKDAVALGFSVTVIRDATIARNAKGRARSFAQFPRVSTTDEVLALL